MGNVLTKRAMIVDGMKDQADTSAVDARRLMRAERTAMLATHGLPPKLSDGHGGDADDWPYASLVEVACDHEGRPILLLSELAVHTSNISRDPRVSLLFDGTRDSISPLTQARLTVSGTASKTDDPGHRSRFLARHPEATEYAGFADFSFWHVAPLGAHAIAGFGRIRSISASEFLVDPALAAQFSGISDGIASHMNEDHSDAIDLIVSHLLGLGGTGWQISCCDPDGMDLHLEGQMARLDFDAPVFDADTAKAILVEMTQRARSAR